MQAVAHMLIAAVMLTGVMGVRARLRPKTPRRLELAMLVARPFVARPSHSHPEARPARLVPWRDPIARSTNARSLQWPDGPPRFSPTTPHYRLGIKRFVPALGIRGLADPLPGSARALSTA